VAVHPPLYGALVGKFPGGGGLGVWKRGSFGGGHKKFHTFVGPWRGGEFCLSFGFALFPGWVRGAVTKNPTSGHVGGGRSGGVKRRSIPYAEDHFHEF